MPWAAGQAKPWLRPSWATAVRTGLLADWDTADVAMLAELLDRFATASTRQR